MASEQPPQPQPADEDARADQAMRGARERLMLHVEHSPLAVIEWDRQWRVTRWSGRAEAIFGWSASEVIGKDWSQWPFVHPDDLPAVRRITQALVTGRARHNISRNRNFTKDGGVVQCEWYNSVLHDGDGNVLSILSFVQDVTAQIDAEAKLRQLNTQLETRVAARTAELEKVNKTLESEVSERDQITRALREQTRMLELMLESIAEGVVVADAAGNFLIWNAAATRIVGLGAADLPIEHWPEVYRCYRADGVTLYDPADLPMSRAIAGQTVNEEPMVIRREGEAGRRISINAQPLIDGDGHVLGGVIVFRDDTERKAAEEALGESERRYRLLAEHATDMISLHDNAGRFTYVSPACRTILGYEPEALLGQRPRDLGHPDDRDLLNRTRLEAATAGDTVVRVYRMRRKDGSYVWVESTGRRNQGADEDEQVVVVTRDVTGRRIAEEALRLVQAAVDQVDDSVVITDAQIDAPGPHILYVNPAFERMTGYTEQEVMGKSPRILQGPLTERAVLDRIRAAMLDERPFHGQTVNYRKDGSTFYLEWHISPIRNEHGRVEHWVSIQRDVTSRRREEELRRQHQAQLSHVGRLSTLGEMASGLAHELNQPLSAIGNYISGCLRRFDAGQIDQDQLREALTRVGQQAERAGRIIHRLRDFVKKGEPKRGPVDVNQAVREAVGLIGHDANDRGIELRLELAEHLPAAEAEVVQVEQVVINLIRNAIEAIDTDAGHQPLVRVVTAHDADQRRVLIRVIDRGGGGSEQQMNHMFDPFFTTKASGMGMGLNISQSIAEAYEGRLWATRNPEGGMTFHLALPTA